MSEAFGITKARRPFDRIDFDLEPHRPSPDPLGEALGYTSGYYATGEMIDGILKSERPKIRYQFGRRYFTKPINVLVDLFDATLPELSLGEYLSDEQILEGQRRRIVRQREESILRASAVQAYNAAHPESRFGYWAVWRQATTLDLKAAQDALAGGIVPLPDPNN